MDEELRAMFAARGITPQHLAQFVSNHGGGQLKTVTKTVHRDGKTFEQTFHVAQPVEKKGEAPDSGAYVAKKKGRTKATAAAVASKPAADSTQPAVKHAPPATASGATKTPAPSVDKAAAPKKTRSKKVSGDEALAQAGADPKVANRYIDKRGEHAGNESSISLRAAWAEQSGVKLDEKRLQTLYAHASRRPEGEIAGAVKRNIEKGSSPAVAAAAKAITKVSQQAYEGQTHVEVHRGIAGEQARLIKEAIARGDKTVKLSMDSASSFTDDHRIAVQFAKGTGGSYKGADKSGGVVIKLKAPVSSILASHKAFPDQFDKKEKEVVIASHGVIEIPISDIELY